MTSSARLSTEGEIARPSALAVLRLMTSSNFSGRSIGSSLGFAPVRTLPTEYPTTAERVTRREPRRHVASVFLHDHHLLRVTSAALAKPLFERLEQRGIDRVPAEHSDTGLLSWRLRLDNERRGDEAAGPSTEECSTLHYLIT